MIFEIDSREFDEYVKLLITGELKVDENSFAVCHARSIELHSEGDPENPKLKEMLERRRPNEPLGIVTHRLANFRPITKAEFERVENTLHVIYNPRNYSIAWPEMKILKGEDGIEYYFTEGYPEYGSLVKYFEQSLNHNILCDPALVFIAPFIEESEEGQEHEGLVKPFPYFISSYEIIEHADEHLVIKQDGNFILADKFSMIKGVEITKSGGSKEWEWEVVWEHNLNFLPVVKLPGVEKTSRSLFGKRIRKESYVAGVLPYWDKAILSDSDRDAVQVRFAHPREWEWKTKCDKCKGTGKIAMSGMTMSGDLKFKTCDTCGGSGDSASDSPFGKFKVDVKAIAETGVNPPPHGFTSPDSAILQEIRTIVRENINDGFGALNMHHLNSDNLGESGTAKIVGRKDLNTFMLKISNGVWDCYKEIVTVSCRIRYEPSGQFNPDEMPDITRPVEFDIYTSDELTAKVSAAKTAGMDSSYIKLLQVQTAKKDFGDTSKEALFFVALQEIDPFPNSTADDLMALASSIKQIDKIVHANINNLMNQAMQADNTFLYKERSQQREVIYKLAETLLAEINKSKAMIPVEDNPPAIV